MHFTNIYKVGIIIKDGYFAKDLGHTTAAKCFYNKQFIANLNLNIRENV